MPVQLSVPLPGPFRYTAPIGQQHHRVGCTEVFFVWPLMAAILVLFLAWWAAGIGVAAVYGFLAPRRYGYTRRQRAYAEMVEFTDWVAGVR